MIGWILLALLALLVLLACCLLCAGRVWWRKRRGMGG